MIIFKSDISPSDLFDYTIFGAGLAFSSFKEFSHYLQFDFPIVKVNDYLYAGVLAITIFVGVKRLAAWAYRGIKLLINKDKSK